ncbi:MAG TPA: glycerophosphodiester phosphodiesterase family protein [Candidatus Hydrogenedentes bacterium]|nr:glycerophosphodiester phosphodiesterase family protein [Candidatus Hydrogenedentota bacterium]
MIALLLTLLPIIAEPPPPVLERQPNHGGVYVIAHRGAHDGIPENTPAAYRRAIELGADFVEIDLRETRDGQFVSVHNHTVDAYTKDASGPVNTFTLAELKALDIGGGVAPEWSDERIPSFDEILELCKGRIGVYLDLKQGDVEKILALVHQHDMANDIVWYAGTPHLRRLRELCPECLIMPDPGPEENLPRILEMFQPKVVASVWRHINESFVRRCHDARALVFVDDGGAATWEALLSLGVDGVQTDDVAALIRRLKNGAVSASATAP